MEKQNQAQREAVTELYRREADKLSALVQEAEELLQEGQMLYREGTEINFQKLPLTDWKGQVNCQT